MGKVLALVSLAILVGCGPLSGALSSLTPGVAANVQAGQTNTQTIGQTENRNVRIVRPQGRVQIDESVSRADTVTNQTINQGIPWIYWVALVFALLLDSPARWPGQVYGVVKQLWSPS